MRLTTAQKILMAAALADNHGLTVGQAIDYVDTAAGALLVDEPDLVVVAAMFETTAAAVVDRDIENEWFDQQTALADEAEIRGVR